MFTYTALGLSKLEGVFSYEHGSKKYRIFSNLIRTLFTVSEG